MVDIGNVVIENVLFPNDDEMGGEHKCPVCDATFTRPQHVARHMRSHTGDRPYRCQFCPDQFARSDLLNRHVNKCHEAEKPRAGPPGRKGSRTALRATTSRQTCDQCVKSSLSCDGAKPCARCTQRKIRCTFVEFNRQTAPAGPGHPEESSPLSSSSKSSSTSSLRGLVQPPFSTTALSRSDFVTTAPLPPPALDLLYTRPSIPEMSGDYTSTIKHEIQPWAGDDVQRNQQQFYPDQPSAWNQAFYNNTGGDNDLQQFVPNITNRRRGSLDYGGSVGSGSSASSSSSHLPIEAIPIHQPFQFNTSFDTYHNQGNPSSEDTQAPFNSAFGVLSIHDPDAAPFFSHLPELHSQQRTGAASVVGTGMISDPNATPMARDDLTWSQLINPSSHAMSTPTGFQTRRRATSMFTVRTPTAAPEAFLQSDHGVHAPQPINTHRLQQPHHDQFHRQPPQQATYGVVHPPIHAPVPVEDLSSWSAKIQSQRPPELRLAAAKVKARRQTLSGGEPERERNSQLLHPTPTPALALAFRPTPSIEPAGNAKLNVGDLNPTSLTAYRGSASPVDPHTRSSSSSTASWESSTGTNSESGMRPAFKRLPSATPLEHDRERKRVFVSYAADTNGRSGPGSGPGECAVPKLEELFEHDREAKHGLSYTGAENVVPKIEDGENVGAETTAGPVPDIMRVMNLAERRRRASADAGAGGGDMTFSLQLGAL